MNGFKCSIEQTKNRSCLKGQCVAAKGHCDYGKCPRAALEGDLPGQGTVSDWLPGLVLVNLNPEEASDKNPLTQAVGASQARPGANCLVSEGASRGVAGRLQ